MDPFSDLAVETVDVLRLRNQLPRPLSTTHSPSFSFSSSRSCATLDFFSFLRNSTKTPCGKPRRPLTRQADLVMAPSGAAVHSRRSQVPMEDEVSLNATFHA